MDHSDLPLPGLRLLCPKKRADERGYFSEVYSADAMKSAGIDTEFVQDNQSLSVRTGTIRGLHFQAPPFAQAKLVRVLRGRILDVAVDVRRGSPTYGRHATVELSEENWQQLFIPVGFAHGFCTLTDNTEVIYKVSAPYSAESDGGILWNDPELGIAWPELPGQPVLSAKDVRLPTLRSIESPFEFHA